MRRKFNLVERKGFLLFDSSPRGGGGRVQVWFTTRRGPRASRSFNVDPRGRPEGAAARGQAALLGALGLRGVFLPTQVHGRGVIPEAPAVEGFVWGEEADAVCAGPGRAVGVMTADCLPLVIFHRSLPLALAVHAGWRGLEQGIVGSAVDAAVLLGARPGELEAWLGPCIGPCCYEVGEDVAGRVAEASGGAGVVPAPGGRPRLDLTAAAAAQLAAAGLGPGSLESAALCTACHPQLFHSWRRDGEGAGRMAAIAVVGE